MSQVVELVKVREQERFEVGRHQLVVEARRHVEGQR
jgi:hypothetical protein